MNYSIIHAKLYDGTKDMSLMEDMTVEVTGSVITKIEKSAKPTDGYKVIDLNGKYLMPGLVNLHVHLASEGKAPKKDAKPVNYKKLFDTLSKIKLVLKVLIKQEEGFAASEVYSGVTTMRTVGGILDFDARIRDKIKTGVIDGPDIICANTAVSVPGGHFAGSLATEAENADMAREHVQMIHKTNPDVIKLMITGGVMDASESGEPGVLRMSPEIVKASCDEAHKLGYKVAAHVESSEGVKVALENGVDTIEHGARCDEDIIRLFKERHAADVCTLSPALPYSVFPLEISHTNEMGKVNGDYVFNGIIECAKACLENDIPVGLGTDTGCPFITHYNMWRELSYFVKYVGVTPAFSLHTATLINAQILGLADRIGSIEVGKDADMIVSECDPLENFANLRQLKYVFAKGKMIADPKPKKLKNVDLALDQYM